MSVIEIFDNDDEQAQAEATKTTKTSKPRARSKKSTTGPAVSSDIPPHVSGPSVEDSKAARAATGTGAGRDRKTADGKPAGTRGRKPAEDKPAGTRGRKPATDKPAGTRGRKAAEPKDVPSDAAASSTENKPVRKPRARKKPDSVESVVESPALSAPDAPITEDALGAKPKRTRRGGGKGRKRAEMPEVDGIAVSETVPTAVPMAVPMAPSEQTSPPDTPTFSNGQPAGTTEAVAERTRAEPLRAIAAAPERAAIEATPMRATLPALTSFSPAPNAPSLVLPQSGNNGSGGTAGGIASGITTSGITAGGITAGGIANIEAGAADATSGESDDERGPSKSRSRSARRRKAARKRAEAAAASDGAPVAAGPDGPAGPVDPVGPAGPVDPAGPAGPAGPTASPVSAAPWSERRPEPRSRRVEIFDAGRNVEDAEYAEYAKDAEYAEDDELDFRDDRRAEFFDATRESDSLRHAETVHVAETFETFETVETFEISETSEASETSETGEAPKSRRSRSRRGRGKKNAGAGSPDESAASGAEENTPASKSVIDDPDADDFDDFDDDDTPVTPPKTDRRMLVSVLPRELVEVVIMDDGKVQEYYVEMEHQAKIRGNIYKAVVSNIDVNLQAAFVNYGNVKNGFLQIDEVHPEYWLTHHESTKGHKYPPIQKVMKPGQEVLVQVVKEPNGAKGAFLTTWVSLAGRFLVLTPGQEQIGISRKVEDGEERNRLRELIKGLNPGEGLGAIVRTVSAGTSKTTLQKDLSFLKRVWKDIRKRAGTEKAPCLIYKEPSLATRAVRDYLSDDVAEVWVDDAETAEAIRDMTSLLFPRKADLMHLHQNSTKTLWEQFKVRKDLDQIHAREVFLPSGGRLVFDQTEALMAIDINSGKSGGKTNFESMALRTNVEAAEMIAHQLRLRDIGGQVVIDFIEMRDQSHCREVEKTMRNAMKGDRARYDIGKMSSFGLMQIVRQRIGSSAISISQEPCPHCTGTGLRRNMEWQSLQILRDLKVQMRNALTTCQPELLLPLETELAVYILNHKRERLCALEKEFGVRLEIRVGVEKVAG